MNKIMLNIVPNTWAENTIGKGGGEMIGEEGSPYRGILSMRWWSMSDKHGHTMYWNYLWWNPPDENDPTWKRLAATTNEMNP